MVVSDLMPIFILYSKQYVMETKTATNGKAVQGAGHAKVNGESKPTAAKNGTPVAEEAKEPVQDEKPAGEKPMLTVEDKIKKVNSLNELIQKRTVLKSHLDKVQTLKFGDYEEKDTIAITSGNGQTYTIKSSVLCQKIGGMLKSEISAKIAEVEEEIAF